MTLASGLRIQPGSVACLVGAGGKTTAIQQLASELASKHAVLATTTTHLGREQVGFGRHVVADSETVWQQVMASMAPAAPIVVTGPQTADGAKWQGVDPHWIDHTHHALEESGGVLLVEADGSRGRSFKAPASHEPVIPSSTDLVVVVASAGAIGEPLSERAVHRPQLVAELSGLGPDDPITPMAMASVLTSEAGGLKAVPESAEVRLLLTGVSEARRQSAGSLADLCLQSPRVRAVMLADLLADQPIYELHGRTAAVVLAAGGSSRMAAQKQTLIWRGKPLVRRAVEAAEQAGLKMIVVVAGHQAEKVASAVADTHASVVTNRDWEAGQAGSLRLGLRAVVDKAEAAIFLLADMPLTDAALIRRLVDTHARTLASIVAPERDGRLGNPVLFDRETFADLLAIEGDRGGRALFQRYPVHGVTAGDSAFIDIDDELAWQAFLEAHGS